jgi:hypothetical protein
MDFCVSMIAAGPSLACRSDKCESKSMLTTVHVDARGERKE